MSYEHIKRSTVTGHITSSVVAQIEMRGPTERQYLLSSSLRGLARQIRQQVGTIADRVIGIDMTLRNPYATVYVEAGLARIAAIDIKTGVDIDVAVRASSAVFAAAKRSRSSALTIGILGELVGYSTRSPDQGYQAATYARDALARERSRYHAEDMLNDLKSQAFAANIAERVSIFGYERRR